VFSYEYLHIHEHRSLKGLKVQPIPVIVPCFILPNFSLYWQSPLTIWFARGEGKAVRILAYNISFY